MQDADDEEDEVVAEYPVFASNSTNLFNHEGLRVVNVHYPLRPPFRPYQSDNISKATYKSKHRILTLDVSEDRPDGAPSKTIPLSGRGEVPQVPLCALCKVDGALVLVAVDETTRMRPDMAAFVQDKHVRDEAVEASNADPDYSVKPSKTQKGEGKASKTPASTSKQPGSGKSLKVEVQRQETERQAQLRTRSYTHHREKIDAEAAKPLKVHGLSQGESMLLGACRKLLQQCPGEVAMRVPRKEFLRHASPAFWVLRRPQHASTLPAAAAASAVAAAPEPPPKMDAETSAALKAALEDLFEDHPVVTMRDVRVWLQAYTVNMKARSATLQSDATLASLLIGGGSVSQVRGRFILNTPDDPVRGEIVKLLQARPEGLRKADAMAAIKAAGVTVSDHSVSRTLRALCVAAGAVWHLKEGATFQKI